METTPVTTPAPDPDRSRPDVRWGILGTGRIAHTFARDLAVTPGARLVAVGSRSWESAAAFAVEHADAAGDEPESVHVYPTYGDLARDHSLDVVYVATPHSRHEEDVRLLLAHEQAVLCEKPMTLDAVTTEALLADARAAGVFCMEAMWTACHPRVREAARRLRAGDFGTPRQLRAGLGFRVDDAPGSRMWDPALGASAVLDMGIYPLTLAHLLLGEPDTVGAAGRVDDRGVDTDAVMALTYPQAVAALTVTMTSFSHNDAMLATDTGRLHFSAPFHRPERVTFTPVGPEHDGGEGAPVEIGADAEVIGKGYGHEILEVRRCLAAGELESPLWSHATSVALARQIDEVLAQLGARGR